MTDMNRRKALAAIGSVGAVALAGCAAEDDDGGGGNNSTATGVQNQRPQLPADPSELSQPDQHLVALAEYQTDLLEEIHDEVV